MTGDYTRIARALNFIADRVDDQPELEAIAGEVGLSPFHLQRVFTDRKSTRLNSSHT